jgi:transposase
MASLSIHKKGNYHYVTVVESFRDPETGKPKSRQLVNLGKVDEKTMKSFRLMGQKLLRLCGESLEQIQERGVKELGRYNYGYVKVVRLMLKGFGLDAFLNKVSKRNKLTYNLLDYVVLMLAERLNEPRSKLSNYNFQTEYLGLGKLELHHFYRSLEYVAHSKEAIQQHIYQSSRDLFNQTLDVVFYDVTTFYFDSEIEKENALRQKGFSKDGKIGNTQVVMGLLIDGDKRPICYQLYKGDTWEGKTFSDALDKLKKQYQIDKVIVVADRGMMSKSNLNAVVDNGFQFIVGERLRALPESVQNRLIDLKKYELEWVMNEDKNLVVRYCQTEYEGRIIIGTWSKVRADKDKHEREERIARGEKLLKSQTDISKKARLYYLKPKKDKKGEWEPDEEKKKKAERFDGFLAIATNAKDLSTAQILNQYKHLFQVEHSFRSFKTFLETRPMFHWNDTRIEGHICLCYMAYSILTEIQIKLLHQKTPLSENKIRKALDHMQLSEIQQGNEHFYIRSSEKEEVKILTESLKMKPIPEMMHKSQIFNYI